MWQDDDEPSEVDRSDDPGLDDAERRRVRCGVCDIEVSGEEQVFVFDDDAVSVFVNQHGFAHEILTVRATWNVVATGPATTEFTWFAGYAWRHLLCASCGHHLGWVYRTTADARPAGFCALRTAEIRLA